MYLPLERVGFSKRFLVHNEKVQINRQREVAPLLSSLLCRDVGLLSAPPLCFIAPAAAPLHYQTLRDGATPRAHMQRSYAALLHI